MPNTMKALVYDKPESFAIKEVPIPDIAPNQVYIESLLSTQVGSSPQNRLVIRA